MSDSPRGTDNVSLWQRIIRLGRHRTANSAVVEGIPAPATNSPEIIRGEVAQSGNERSADLEEGTIQTMGTAYAAA